MSFIDDLKKKVTESNSALIYRQEKSPVAVRLEHVSKIYEDPKTHRHFYAVKDSNLVIQPGEFVTLLGPSGCGKTTTLRMVAGFESPDEGQVYIGDTPVNALTPNQRDTAMVFQSYALFPHYNVFDNVAYGLKLRKLAVPKVDENNQPVLEIDNAKVHQTKAIIKAMEKKLKTAVDQDREVLEKELEHQRAVLEEASTTPVQAYDYRAFTKEEIKEKVLAMLELVELKGMEDRMTNQLSGGQQQRVALARALVLNPSVLLFDEPLSNLDAKLRVSMRTEIRKIQQKVGITALYVTHDQSEAMALSDRIIIMNKGFISQVGSPKEVYYEPQNEFIADFIGEVNFIEGKVESTSENEMIVKTGTHEIHTPNPFGFKAEDEVKLVLRPEASHLAEQGDIKVQVVLSTFMGSYQLYHAMLGDNLVKITEYNPRGGKIFEVGEEAFLSFEDRDVHALPGHEAIKAETLYID
jgi:ABC-type Fe3+/spermidine/putrescine transport system ATPase subunit